MRDWLKGGLIGAGIGLVYFFIRLIIVFFKEPIARDILTGPVGSWFHLVFWGGVILGFIEWMVIGFVVGIIIGFVIQKMRNRTKSSF
tara:strand:+ start:886 stop:1146 length:261 start_codon:yes stop_codon:yes gene_type:complete